MDLPQLETERLILRHARPDLAAPLAEYVRRNRAHLARWSPPSSTDLETAEGWVPLLDEAVAQWQAGSALRWVLVPRDAAACVIGRVSFTNVQRGPFQSCFLGYQIDAMHEGRGLMREALACAIADAFATLRLHRIEANYQPENVRSGALLARLGFERIGRAPRYLFIDGAWRDHVQTQRLNDAFDPSWLPGISSARAGAVRPQGPTPE